MTRLTQIALTLAAFCLPAFPQSQTSWETVKALAPGTQIRIAPKVPGNVKGKVEAVTEDSIQVQSGKAQKTILRSDIAWISVRVSRRGKHVAHSTRTGAIIGAGIGLGFGLLCSAAVGTDGAVCYIAVPVGAGMYAGMGALIGAISPAGEWREIYRQ
jgi:hypothetical protein